MEKGVEQALQHLESVSPSGHIQTNPRRDRCKHVSTNPQRVQSMAKPISREANMEIKHRNKQTNMDMHKGNDPNPLI